MSSSKAIFLRLLRMLRPYAPMIVLGLVLLVLAAPCELFPAIAWKFVVDDLALQKPESPWLHAWFSFGGRVEGRLALLIWTVIWMFIVYLAGETLETLEQWILNRVAQKFILHLRDRVYGKLQSQSLSYLQRQRVGDLMSRAMSDIDELQTFIVNGIDVIIGEGLLWIATVAIVLWMDWRVATISLAPLILVYVLLRYFNKKIKPIYAAARQRLGDVGARLQENLNGIAVIKIFGREKQEAERFGEANHRYYRQQIKAINARSLFFPFTRGVGFLSNVFMIGVGGYFMLYGTFTPGKLVAFRAYWWRLFGPIQTLARVNDMVQRAIAAGRRVFEVLDAPDEMPDAPDALNLPSVRGQLDLRNVRFRYQPDAVPPVPSLAESSTSEGTGGTKAPIVLNNVTLRIEPGQRVALAGPSGSGKSTILNLLLRFYDPEAGRVLLDGHDLRQLHRDSLRRHFALVQQETFLFDDSILDNIRYGHPDATMEQVIAAAQAANAHAFITELPRGYDTPVGERGVRLSGGQKQRLSIARAFLADPKVLLLDEPTSSVEPDSESAIIAALDRLMAGRTTVLTSHRPALIAQADWVYVIQGGRITEQGPPHRLRREGGWFGQFMRSANGEYWDGNGLPSPTTPDTPGAGSRYSAATPRPS
jgi:ABC-type multidrug transport system fused ATPase/permease subunit